MLKHVATFGKYVAIAGFREVAITGVDRFLNTAREQLGDIAVQFFDAGLIAGWQHLYFAALNALKAFQNRTNISRDLAIECLLYACAQRQIRVALARIGIKQNSSQIAVLVIAESKGKAIKTLNDISRLVVGKRDDRILALTARKMGQIRQLFGISDQELATKVENSDEAQALSNLVLEHMALLVTQK